METLLDRILEAIPFVDTFGPGILIPLISFALVGTLAQWSLYDKCGLPGVHCLIPVQNVITFLKIMGRPASHSLIVMIPPPVILGLYFFVDNPIVVYGLGGLLALGWAIFMVKVYIELCQSFGHFKTMDYILVTVFNGFYVLHLGLSYSEDYKGPVYGKKKEKDSNEKLEGQLA